ncbi:MAG: sulfur carrier protein ThiS [Veillonella sp.]|uniref:sulfur carrier protein ThiS n=1 Tax=Veillonella sp. TaxID=1926307 RepID=UPI0025EE6876|nr:sulfur carrier protein ThiS [Veillonella sp.]MBS5336909.1 sulfur carrier protein ThiS [Veillonella sp.]
MEIIINGEAKLVVSNQLSTLLDELGYAGKRFVVELNGEIISKELYTTTVLTAADRLEIVSFVGGG